MRYASRFNSMNVKQISSEVRKLVNELNTQIIDFRNSGQDSELLDKALAELQNIGGVGKGGGLSVGTRLKTKQELIQYAERLQMTKSWDTFTEAGIKKRKEAEDRAYKTFTKTHPNFSKEDYNNLGKVFSKLKDIFEHFDSEQMVEVWKFGKDNKIGNDTFDSIVNEVFTNYKKGEAGKEYTPENVQDDIMKRLQEYASAK